MNFNVTICEQENTGEYVVQITDELMFYQTFIFKQRDCAHEFSRKIKKTLPNLIGKTGPEAKEILERCARQTRNNKCDTCGAYMWVNENTGDRICVVC